MKVSGTHLVQCFVPRIPPLLEVIHNFEPEVVEKQATARASFDRQPEEMVERDLRDDPRRLKVSHEVEVDAVASGDSELLAEVGVLGRERKIHVEWLRHSSPAVGATH